MLLLTIAFVCISAMFAHAVRMLPEAWRLALVRFHTNRTQAPRRADSPSPSTSTAQVKKFTELGGAAVGGIMSLLHPTVVRNCLHMALEEMHVIDEIPADVLKKEQQRMTFFFSPVDAWVAKGEEEAIIKHCPDARVVWADHHIPHAFVVRHAQEVADHTWKWLLEIDNKE